MFSKQNYWFFLIAFALLFFGFTGMAIDPVENGFGFLTLWLAPPLLLAGFALPALGIIGWDNLKRCFSFQAWKENKWKHGVGLIVFSISFLVYFLTLEPTASLWDCSEFIACAYKLQVPHTPGTPLSLVVGRLFAMLSFGNVHTVAWNINLMSGFFSALAVYIVYHIIFYFGERTFQQKGKNTNTLLIVSSVCGSLCLAFSDSFWFSAVEAEIYGLACFFMLLLLWLMLKGKDLPEPIKSRWLIVIAYLAGLSYCIHPMCLLVFPLLPFLWYTHQRPITIRNVILSALAGLVIVLLINRFVAVGLFELAFYFDLFFVNTFNLPFYFGVLVLIILLAGVFNLLLKKLTTHGAYTWSVIFLLLGFVPYLMLFIRSNRNPPIDETNPENLAMIKAYMNRESYGSNPLLYGPYFDARIDDVTVRKKAHYKDDSEYKVAGNLVSYEYEKSRQTFLPRMYSRDKNHIETYREWTGLRPGEKPKFVHNVTFMLKYQLGHMYFRYFMWNFAGRESDVQHSGWLKPWENTRFFDNADRARNQYWTIPLLLGVAGMVFQFQNDKKNFFTNTLFFLITGVVLALYLNSTPNEPRERDYIYVGSYIAFTIWIGLGILNLGRIISKRKFTTPVLTITGLIVPAWMLLQNVDDHNRSGRTFQMDHARNILKSCAPDAILFTGGDNDTFPFWYMQEVEGVRTDVRVVVLSYFNTDWYINQLRKPYYDSRAFRLTLDRKDYRQYGFNDVLYVDESIKEGIDFEKYLTLLKEEHPAIRMHGKADEYNILPSRKLKLKMKTKPAPDELKLNPQNVRETEGELTIHVKGNYLEKNALALLDVVISNQWERPVYFNFTSINTLGIDVQPYVVQEGSVFRLTPYENKEGIFVNTELSWKNLIEKADYGNLANEKIYFSHEDFHARMIVPVRQSFNDLAEAFIKEGNTEKAAETLQHAVKNLYHKHLKPSYTDIHAVNLLFIIGRSDLAESLTQQVFDYYYNRITSNHELKKSMDRLDVYLLQESSRVLKHTGDKKYLSKMKAIGF